MYTRGLLQHGWHLRPFTQQLTFADETRMEWLIPCRQLNVPKRDQMAKLEHRVKSQHVHCVMYRIACGVQPLDAQADVPELLP